MATDLINAGKDVFNAVSDKDNFSDEPNGKGGGKSFTSRMMWWNYFIMFVLTAIIIWLLNTHEPRKNNGQYREDLALARVMADKEQRRADSLGREITSIYKEYLPQVRQNAFYTDSLLKRTIILEAQLQIQNEAIKNYNQSFKKIQNVAK